ncbi:aldo/keto reductase [Celerinatantimonas sp. YJH-8]|uniref:aldo/keto reductase n=1 Tax=Celerinatantimonas sp. YJH-8 TaxID=3228714 RepID=UPI0038C92E14
MSIIKTVSLKDGTELPVLGQGTWLLGDEPGRFNQEIDTLHRGIELGLSLIDTAEMYGDGRSEVLVGEAIRDCREQVFLVSKVLPNNAAGAPLADACERSLERLKTNYLDLYLLHWRGGIPLQQTIEGMEQLRRNGQIRRWGVSNFDTCDMDELLKCEGGEHCQVNQVLYHLASRGTEFDLQPFLARHQVTMMAHAPLAQAGRLCRELLGCHDLRQIADEHEADPFQIMLAWCIRQHHVMAIPKASTIAHVESNARAAQIELTEQDLQRLDLIFPEPDHKLPLDFI